ncbi:MAG: hypothetical protein LKE41_05635 [Prevotella sp.]|jgi:hypothetical protein|nr:hypothetical protein [Prevotella sp.]MCI2081036.1 hypothetical protein [Prevotella sp.]MCI2102925.1 hypothetical protein [Prevotella sp.]
MACALPEETVKNVAWIGTVTVPASFVDLAVESRIVRTKGHVFSEKAKGNLSGSQR